MTSNFDRYTSTLVATWEAFTAAAGGDVVRGPGFISARHPDPIFNNSLLLRPDSTALAAIATRYERAGPWAVWTNADDTAASASAAGLQRDVTTQPMMADLTFSGPSPEASIEILDGVEVAVIAELNGLPTSLVHGVEGLRATVTADGTSGLLTFQHDGDLNISFVATQPDARGRGLASALVSRTLDQARRDGLRTASLQATPMGLGLYKRLGFVPLGEWQEWTPPSRTAH